MIGNRLAMMTLPHRAHERAANLIVVPEGVEPSLPASETGVLAAERRDPTPKEWDKGPGRSRTFVIGFKVQSPNR
jgi:hypothetical protein